MKRFFTIIGIVLLSSTLALPGGGWDLDDPTPPGSHHEPSIPDRPTIIENSTGNPTLNVNQAITDQDCPPSTEDSVCTINWQESNPGGSTS